MNRRSIDMPLFSQTATAPREDRPRTMRVTLPWPEAFEIDLGRGGEPERLPPPIRSDFDWRKDSVLRYAARVKQ